MKRIAILIIGLAGIAHTALAQNALPAYNNSSRPTVGGTSGLSPIPDRPTIGPSEAAIRLHRDFTGKPCLSVGGYARPHTIDPNLYDHVIIAINSCPQRITMQVCYYGSQDCIPMEIQGGERREAVLGSLPSMKDFRFEYREKF